MQARAIGNALATALISIILMLGALSISLVEFVPELTPTTPPIFPSSLPVTLTFTAEPTVTPLILETPTVTNTFTPTITATSPSTCQIPAGWGQMIVQPYDTLENIAARYRINATQLSNSNCLAGASPLTGSVLYVPAVPTNTPVTCVSGVPGWIKYTVRSGDTFYSISTNYGATIISLKNVNCRISDRIYAGEILWVPNNPTRMPPRATSTPLPGDTSVPYPSPTEPLTETPLPYTVTAVPTAVPNTPTPIPTNTLAPPTLTASPTVFP